MLEELSNLLDEELEPLPKSSTPARQPKSARAYKSDPETREQTVAEGGFTTWQTIIWREWCHSKDDDYAYYLFNLVESSGFGQRFVIIMAVLGLLSGALVGYGLGMLISRNANFIFFSWDFNNLLPLFPLALLWIMGIAGGFLGLESSRRFRGLYFWRQGQPLISHVEWALQQALSHRPDAKIVWEKPLHRLTAQKKETNSAADLIESLKSLKWDERFVARQALIALGGEATLALSEIAADNQQLLWETAMWLLTSIEQNTSREFAGRAIRTQCPYCQTRFKANSVPASLVISFTCYGCRSCQQSRTYLDLPRGAAAVLDSEHLDREILHQEPLRINWLVSRRLFDFDRVEIVAANDEAVERFAVQIGNDTDSFRRPRYKQMTCTIGPDCKLSENTLRILQRTFNLVNIVEPKRINL